MRTFGARGVVEGIHSFLVLLGFILERTANTRPCLERGVRDRKHPFDILLAISNYHPTAGPFQPKNSIRQLMQIKKKKAHEVRSLAVATKANPTMRL